MTSHRFIGDKPMTEYTIAAEPAIAAATANMAWDAYDADSTKRVKQVTAAQLVAYGMQSNFRNLLDGGDFTTNPFQRGTSQAADISNSVTYMADRWATVGGASSAINWSKQADTGIAGFGQALRWQRKSANADTASISFGQVLESADSIRCQGQFLTLSFYVKCGANFLASSANFNVKLITGTGTDDTFTNMQSGAWSGSANAISATVTPTTSDQLITLTTAAAIATSVTQIGVLISYTPSGTAGANEWLQFKGFQLEIGSAFSGFEHRDVQVELEICQRYCWVTNEPAAGVVVGMGSMQTTTAATIYMATPVQMRAAPTLTVTAGTLGCRPANAAISGTAAAGTTHTPNAISISVTSITASTAGFATPLLGNGGSGKITASADY
jgi:hypothetical protein